MGAFFLGVGAAFVGGFFLLVLIGLAVGDDVEGSGTGGGGGWYDTLLHPYVSPEEAPDIGDCLEPGPDGADVTTRDDVVSCGASHGSEVADVVDAPGPTVRPFDDDLAPFGDEACYLAFEAYVGSNYDDSDLDYQVVLPDAAAWARGDRSVWCLIDTTGGFGDDGTVRNSHR